MGNASISPAEKIASEEKAAMRRTGIECPPPALMLGGVIRLAANANCLFDWTPLPQHDAWLQGRVTHDEWTALILEINDAALDATVLWRVRPRDAVFIRRVDSVTSGVAVKAAQIRPRWLDRGLDVTSQGGQPLCLYFKPVPSGPSAMYNAASIGEAGAFGWIEGGAAAAAATGAGTGATPGTWACPPVSPVSSSGVAQPSAAAIAPRPVAAAS